MVIIYYHYKFDRQLFKQWYIVFLNYIQKVYGLLDVTIVTTGFMKYYEVANSYVVKCLEA